MLKYIICLSFLLCSCVLMSQSISYSLGYGLSRSQDISLQSTLTESYNKGQEFSLGLGLNGTGTIADQLEMRLSTYESTLINSVGNFTGTTGINLSIRKYIMELQGYYYKLNLKKAGSIDFGSKLSYLIRSDISGYTINSPGNDAEITSADYIREGKLYASVLAKYSLVAIRISDRHRILPSYTFSYSFNKDIRSISINTRLINHIFELSFISDLSKKD